VNRQLQFRGEAFLVRSNEAEARGKPVAELLATDLPTRGIAVQGIDEEDWGWRVSITNADFPLWIGCGHYEEYPDGWLCFVEPAQAKIRRWLKSIDTTTAVQQVADAMLSILQNDARVNNLRWWTDDQGLEATVAVDKFL